MKIRFAVPFFLFLAIFILLWRGLSLHPSHVPSPLINKPVPIFKLETLSSSKQFMTDKDFQGHVTLLNVWATWCYACAEEQAFLLQLSKENKVDLYGLSYKDDPSIIKEWLEKYGNPYKMIAIDRNGQVAIDWGVYGTPEIFVIDKKGVIRYKQTGPIDADSWEKILKPLIEQLANEPV